MVAEEKKLWKILVMNIIFLITSVFFSIFHVEGSMADTHSAWNVLLIGAALLMVLNSINIILKHRGIV